MKSILNFMQTSVTWTSFEEKLQTPMNENIEIFHMDSKSLELKLNQL